MWLALFFLLLSYTSSFSWISSSASALKVLYLDRVRDRQGFQILYAEAAQKLFRGPEQDRTSGGIQTPQLPDQAVFYQLVDGVVTFYPSDLSISAFVTGCLYAMMDKVSSITSDSAGF